MGQPVKPLWAAAGALALVAVGGCSSKGGTGARGEKLIIISPHGINIRHEFTRAFVAWYKAKYHKTVHVEWPSNGGTNDCVRRLALDYAARNTSGDDLFFGGGSATFNEALKRGWLVRPHLPPAVLKGIPANIHGVELRAPGDRWVGATMSYFGMVVNVPLLKKLHDPVPQTWADLTRPQLLGRLSLGDPSGSGSVRTCYEMVLQQYGWRKGFGLLARMFGACAQVQVNGSDPAEETGTGNAAAGVVIDFFGRLEVAKVGAGIVRFIVPRGGSSLDSDPIAILKGAPHRKLAERFMAFVLSPRGQKLWVFNPGTPGGPKKHALGRMTVLPALYKTDSRYMTDPFDPFTAPAPLKVNARLQRQRSVFLGDLIKSAFIDNHAALQRACRLVAKKGNPPALLAMFNTVPFSKAETATISRKYISGQRAQVAMKARWQKLYAARFAAIVKAAR